MHIRTFKLAKFFRGLYPRAQIQQRTKREWGKGRGREKEGKENVEGMTEGRGGRKVWGIRIGGIAPLLLGGIDATAHVLRMPQMQEMTAGPGQVEPTVGIYWHS